MSSGFGGLSVALPSLFWVSSYGTHAAAAYASQFPRAIRRVAVSGVAAPTPDLLEYAQKEAFNTAQILGLQRAPCEQPLR